ncbi:MAG: hypothetical protein C0500_02275 [Sphingobium sp.]|nr:hypothetical protein [Sphingobium sp.]
MSRVDISAVWDRATEFLGDNLATLIPIALPWIYLPLAVQTAIAPLGKSGDAMATAVQLGSFALTLLGIWGQLQVLALALDPARGAGGARAVATARLVPVLVLTLVLGIAALLLVAPIGVALGMAGFDFQAAMQASAAGTPVPTPPGMTPAIASFILFYVLALLVVMLWVAVRLALVNAVLLEEGGWFGAIGRSFALTRGRTLALIGVFLLFVVVSVVATLAAQTVFGAIFALVLGGEGAVTAATVLTALVVAAVSTAFTLLSAAFIGKFYVAARAQEAIGTA